MITVRVLTSFRWRLAAMLLVILFTTTGLFFLLNYQIEKQILTDQVRRHARVVGKTVRLNLSRLLLPTNHRSLADLSEEKKEEIREFIQHFNEEEAPLDLYGKDQDIRDLFLIDATGRVVLDSPREAEGRILPPEERIDPAILARMTQGEMDTKIQPRGKDTLMLTTFPVFRGDHVLGFGRIEMTMNPVIALQDRIKVWGLLTAAGLFLVGLLLSAHFARSVTKPIGELVQAAVRIGRGDFAQRLDESRTDEIGVLMAAFNRMADDIVKLDETQQRVKKLEVGSQLAALVAHEIKNPLNSIGLIIEHIQDRFAPAPGTEREKFVELATNMKREVDRLNTIVEGFLRSAKPTSLSRQPTDLNDLLDETLGSIAPEVDQRRVTVVRRFEPGLPKVPVDYHQLRQAVVNLLINALQAMPHGGELRLSTAWSSSGRDEILVAIQDTGCGISPEHLPRLFDSYFTTKQRGFGLGLAIVEQSVQAHGGRIAVDSEIGKGSTFTIHLPIERNPIHV